MESVHDTSKDGSVIRFVAFTSMYLANSGFNGFSSASIDEISYHLIIDLRCFMCYDLMCMFIPFRKFM